MLMIQVLNMRFKYVNDTGFKYVNYMCLNMRFKYAF